MRDANGLLVVRRIQPRGTNCPSSQQRTARIGRHTSRASEAGSDPPGRIGQAAYERFQRCTDFAQAFREQTTLAATPSQAEPTTPAPIGRALSTAPQSGDAPVHSQTKTVFLFASTLFLLTLAGELLVWHPWHTDQTPSGLANEPPKPSTEKIAPPESSPAPTTSEMSAPKVTFSPKSIDRVLLTPDQLTSILRTEVTDNPSSGGAGVLTLTSSAYGMSDHASQVTPRSCVGVVFTCEHDVYADAAPTAIKSQVFGNLFGGDTSKPHLLQQTAAVFSSSQQAQDFLTASEDQWKKCSSSDVDAKLGYENGAGYALGTIHRQGNLITVAMATNGGLNGPDACQQAIGARENVIVEVRTCEVPDVQTTYDPTNGWPRDPGWAVPNAGRVAEAMLDNRALAWGVNAPNRRSAVWRVLLGSGQSLA